MRRNKLPVENFIQASSKCNLLYGPPMEDLKGSQTPVESPRGIPHVCVGARKREEKQLWN